MARVSPRVIYRAKSRWFSRDPALCLTTDSLAEDMPLKVVTFPDDYTKLILLKKVGSGYIFIHRVLLEYFAEMTPMSIAGKS
jgi:hypothetical protein